MMKFGKCFSVITRHIILFKKFQKAIDKPSGMWYNSIRKKEKGK